MHMGEDERGRNTRDGRLTLPLQFQSVQLHSFEYRDTLKGSSFGKGLFCEKKGA